MPRGRLATLSAAVGLLALAPAAAANFHLVSIREVAPNPAPEAAFIELQMYASGQTVLSGHPIRLYDADGGIPVTTFNLGQNATNGENQRTYLVGDDATPGADFVNQQLATAFAALGPGGAACFDSVDCVSWGSFTGTGLPSAPGIPAAAIPSGSSLTRSIAPGCSTLLEASDDSDDSATDFALSSPTPRSNSAVPTEIACTTGGGGGTDTDPPQTKIKNPPEGRIERDTVKVRFKSDEPGSSFECRLDRKRYKPCESPRKLKRLAPGRHKFEVRATDAAGNTDGSPAKAKFKLVD